MGFRRQDLQEAFFVPGSHAFRVYGYGTADPLEDVLAAGYFEAGRGQLRPGELIFVSAGRADEPRRGSPNHSPPPQAARAALVMVSRNQRGIPVAVRLVQDFGGPESAAAAPGPAASPVQPDPTDAASSGDTPRRRGRPPGSRSRKPAA